MKKNKFGFTLVELIVVITILVILGTIAFTSLSGFSGSARDSSRVSDLTNLSKGLDIAYIKMSSYPSPDNSFTVTYSGGAVWYQGVIGDSVMRTIGAGGLIINKKPTDPLKNTQEYIYSKIAYGKAYQIRADWEGDSVAYHHDPSFITQVNAATSNPTISYIKGNYNGVVAKTQTGGLIYLLAVPSIVSGTGSIGGVLKIETNDLSGALFIHGGSNTVGVNYNPKMVYQSGALPSNTTEQILFASGIASAYSTNPILASQSSIKIFIDAGTNTGTLATLGGGLVSGSLGGSASIGQQTPPVVVSTKFPGEDGVSGNSDDCDIDNIKIGTGTATEQIWSACNLGATIAFNGSNGGSYNASPSATRGGADAVNGKLYQWGRNKGFASTDTTQLSTQLVSNPNGADTYNFVWNATLTNNDWLNPQLDTLWGGAATDSATVDGQTNDTLRRGPCPSGWHIPSAKDWQDACNTITSGTCTNGMANTSVRTTLALAYAGYRNWNFGQYYNQSTYGYYWSSSPTSTNGFYLGFGSADVWPTTNGNRAGGFSLRCLKD